MLSSKLCGRHRKATLRSTSALIHDLMPRLEGISPLEATEANSSRDQTGDPRRRQAVYAGFVKAAEVSHDAYIYEV